MLRSAPSNRTPAQAEFVYLIQWPSPLTGLSVFGTEAQNGALQTDKNLSTNSS